METRVDELFNFIQKNCLWQFFSRTWDREENINNILAQAEQILLGLEVKVETPSERCFSADARSLVSDFRHYFPWIKDVNAEEIKSMFSELKDRLIDITITHSRNRELNNKLY
ncbi:V-containing nitrogenase subunit delta [Celerinatantimonas sp. YJH-8]|uniref:V-containing nitrogenase subunit delta n=1 Tax=Celerinatantimonas sp. YJH-8 TaxID=3228714 RepID=UPI0038C8C92C